MNLLAINFSPRKNGNTERRIIEIVDRLKPDSQEIFHFAFHKIGYCAGCLKCEEKGECIIKDDWRRLVRKLEKADTVIFGSPIYAWQLAAPVHVFTNRCRMYISYSEGMGFKGLSYAEAKKRYYRENPNAPHPPPFKIRVNRKRDCYIVVTQALANPRRFLPAVKIFSDFIRKMLCMRIKKQYIVASSGAPHGGNVFEIRNNKLAKANGITA